MAANQIQVPITLRRVTISVPIVWSGAAALGNMTTAGFTAGRMLRIASGGGIEERTTAQVLSDIGAAASGHTHAQLHDAVTVSGNGIILTGQQISLSIGTGATQVAAGNHDHSGVYQPVLAAYSTIAALSGYPTAFPTTAAQITDASSVGRSVLTAADQKAQAAVIGCPRVIYHSAVKVSRPADVSTATLATVEIPANSLGPNGWLEVRLLLTGLNTAAVGTRTVTILFGGTTVKTGGPAASQNFFMSQDILICNRNDANSQIVSSRVDRPDFIWGYFTGLGTGGDAGSMALAVDTTVAQNLVISHQSIAPGDTCYLQFLQVIAHYAP